MGCGKSSQFCHSERSEESLFDLRPRKEREIPRFARNDKKNCIFRSLMSSCATYLAFLLLCANMRAAQTRMDPGAPQASIRASRTYTDEVGRSVQVPQDVDRV